MAKFNIDNEFQIINEKLNKLTTKQQVTSSSTIDNALNNAKIEKNEWKQIDHVISVFSDLKNSTGISFDKRDKTMTKLLEYLGYPFSKIHKHFGAKFIDIKGDGGLALYDKGNEVNALLATITLKTYYETNIQEKVKKTYGVDFDVSSGIASGNLLLKYIGITDFKFPVWAGKAINKSALISKELKPKKRNSLIGITDELYKKIEKDPLLKEKLILSCECHDKCTLWKRETLPSSGGKGYYFLESKWCKSCGQGYLNDIKEKTQNA